MRDSLLACAVLVVAICACTVAPPPPPAEGRRPNIVLVMTDDQGYGVLGRHGHPWIETPNLDRLHDASTRFEHFLVSPTCAPTRAALLTGRHPMRNGVTHTIHERERLTLQATTLPQVLAAAGYTSGIFGKWHLGDEAAYQPQARGFDEAFIHGGGGIGQAYDGSCADAPGNKYFDPVVRHNGRFVRTKGFCTDVFFDAALGWIQTQKDRGAPFFAYVSTNAPHGPFVAPDVDKQRFLDRGFKPKHAGFYGMVENLDANVGRLLDALEHWQLLDDTLIVFLSDNGTTSNGAGRPGAALGTGADGTPLRAYNAGMRGMKGSVDEGGVRVPSFWRWDGTFAAGRSIEQVVAHVDLLPTFAALAGAPLPEGQVEGRSLLPLLQDDPTPWPDRLLISHQGRWPKGTDPEGFQWRNVAVRGPRFRLVGERLYDMLADPGQQHDVAAEYPDVVAAMRAAFDAWWQETRPLMVNEGEPEAAYRPYHRWFRAQARAGGIPTWTPPEVTS